MSCLRILAVFSLMLQIEKYRQGSREPHCVDSEKVYDRKPRSCGTVAGKYVGVVQHVQYITDI